MFLVIRRVQFYLILVLVFVIVAAAVILDREEVVATMSLPTSEKVVFIDAGHGGRDPGREGNNGVHEKEINLAIALYLQSYLESSGAMVYMTRVTDEGLYSENDSNKKRADMRQRKEMVNSSDADILVSIHQNSFSQSQYHGGQVFYHGDSNEGMRLAELIQQQFNTFIDSSNERKAKANDNYFVLREISIPSVIVECGFISNPEEEGKLNTDYYQQKIAWGIYVALIEYFNNQCVTTSVE